MTSYRFITFAALAIVSVTIGSACGDDETKSSTSNNTAGGGGSAGVGGQGGGASCQTCAELVQNNAPPTEACAGTSTTLITDLVTCLCQDTVCGGQGQGCFDACTNGTQPDAACLACDETAFMGPCMTEGAACLADTP